MSLLFCLAVHNALGEVQAELLPGETLFAYLYDVYVSQDLQFVDRQVAVQSRYLVAHREDENLELSWRKPPDMEDMGPEVWNPQGVKVLGTPVGTWHFHEAAAQERLAEEEEFLRCIPWVPALQCAWQLLVQCAGPRCYHFLRTVPPSHSAAYAEGYDLGMQEVTSTLNFSWNLEGLPGDARQQEVARRVASLPMRLGMLGLRSVLRTAPAAYWHHGLTRC